MDKLTCDLNFDSETSKKASDYLADQTGLSKLRIKNAMIKGAVWLKKKNAGKKRLRRASYKLRAGDRISLYYDKDILNRSAQQGTCIEDKVQYSVWFKPAGTLSAGTMYGDHCSIMRQVELFFKHRREVFLVHRLDREASGLILFAHSRTAASRLSSLFKNREVSKQYQIEVLGKFGIAEKSGEIKFPIDNRTAKTVYRVQKYKRESNTSILIVSTHSGRLHQIRRHFDMLGFPVMGDPGYGIGNKNTDGLKLAAISLAFQCPVDKRPVSYGLPAKFRL